MKKINLIIPVLLFVLALALRVYMVGSIPNGLQQDETSIGYNAYSILQTGRDEYGKYMPLYFKAFGEYKLPATVYLIIPSIKLFGLNAFSVRLPSAIFGSLTVVLFYFLIKEMFGEKYKYLPLFGGVLMAINPWHLHFSRGVFEVTYALFFIVGGAFLFLRGVNSKNKYLLLLSALFLGVSVYTYNIARLFTPILVLILAFSQYEVKDKTKPNFKRISFFLVPFVLILLPFFTSIFSSGGLSSATGTLIFTSKAVKSQLLEFRAYFLGLPNSYSSIFFNTYVLSVLFYLKNIASYFSANFLFINGSTHGNHGIGNVGMFYLFEMIMVTLGAISYFLGNDKNKKIIFSWSIAVILIASLTREAPQATRSFFLIPMYLIFSALGINLVVNFFLKNKSIPIRVLLSTLLVFGVYNIFYYFNSYYVKFPVEYAKEWRAKDKELVDYIESVKNIYDRVIIDQKIGFVYTSYLFYSKYSPEKFYSSANRDPDDNEGFSRVNSFGKIEIRDIDWPRDANLPNTLIVTNLDNKPDYINSFKEIYYPLRPVFLSINEKISSFVEADSAYSLIRTNLYGYNH